MHYEHRRFISVLNKRTKRHQPRPHVPPDHNTIGYVTSRWELSMHASSPGHQETKSTTPKKTWPRQNLPSALQLRLWRKYISSNFMRYSNKWKQALGPSISRTTPQTDNALHHPTFQRQIESLPLWYSHILHDHQQTSTDIEVWSAF